MSKKIKESKKKENRQNNIEEEMSNEDKLETNNETTAMNEEEAYINEKKDTKRNKSDLIEVEVITKESTNDPKNNYVNLCLFSLSLETVYSLIYMFSSGSLNFIHLLLFFKYNFKFNFFYMFCHQLVLFIFFNLSKNRKSFKKNTGPISFSDFMSFKWFYLLFSIIHSLNYLTFYFAMQLLDNPVTFLSLRKLTYLMVSLYQLLIGIKKISFDKIITMGFLAIGGYICITDDFSKLYLGVFIVMISNYISSAYYIYSLALLKRTGISNLKILFYNSCILVPGLFIMVFISGEFSDIIKYFNEKGYESIVYINSFEGLFICIGISCFLTILTISKYLFNDGKNLSTNVVIINNLNDFLTSGLAYFYIIGFDDNLNVIFGFIMTTIGNIMGNINEKEEEYLTNVEVVQEVR